MQLMELLERIEKDFKQALLNQDKVGLGVLRMLKTAVKNKEIELGKELSEEDLFKVLKNEVKKRKEAIDNYKQGGRIELADKEAGEIRVLENYLPEEMSDKELEAKVIVVVEDLSEEDKSNFGKVIGAVMKELGGSVDGGRVSAMVKKLM